MRRGSIDLKKYSRGFFDVEYSDLSNSCKLDVFLPKSCKKLNPCIVSIHGGSFVSGDKRDESSILPMLNGLNRGYVVVGINYRKATEVEFPTPIEDIRDAIIFLKKNYNKFKIDPENIVVWGEGAGGYLAIMFSLIDHIPFIKTLDEDIRIKGVISWYAPINFSKMKDDMVAANLGATVASNSREKDESIFMGCSVTKSVNETKISNPENYIHDEMCPMLIQHGTLDNVVSYIQSTHFVELVEKINDNIHLDLFGRTIHKDQKFSSTNNIDRIFRFIDEIVKTPK